MTEHVFLVAITVESDGTREEAERRLHDALPDTNQPHHHGVTEWWIAEDDRRDGSDNDSAVFVPMGAQTEIARFLFTRGLTPRSSNPTHLED